MAPLVPCACIAPDAFQSSDAAVGASTGSPWLAFSDAADVGLAALAAFAAALTRRVYDNTLS